MSLSDKFNLQQRFSFAVLGTILLAACLFIGFQFFAMSKYANNYTVRYWQEYTKTFSSSVQYWVILESTQNAKNAALNFAKDVNVLRAAIYGQEKLIASSSEKLFCKPNTANYTATFFIDGVDAWCFYAPIYQDANLLGHVELTISKGEYKAVVRSLFWASIAITVICSLLIFILVNRFSSLFTSALLQMSGVMKGVAQGTRGGRVTFSGASDIDAIRDDFNNMLSMIEINAHILEQAVADRTNELKMSLENSESASRYKTQIMGVNSHEMKTPLHAVASYIQLAIERLEEGQSCDEDVHTYLTKALQRSHDLRDIIDNILLQGRLEADKFEISPSVVAIKPLMGQCADKVAALLLKNRNHIKLSGLDVSFVSDDQVLRHIVNNLLSNACKFTSQGLIELKWWLDGDKLVIQVCDTGCGIPVESRSKIFDAFWQVDMSFSRKHGGHGLGLSITKQFLHRLSGSVSVTDNLKQGTIFTVTLPNLSDRLAHLPLLTQEKSL
jgi:signal transduction histidine kinase